MGHLVQDAPEVLIGLACAVFGGTQVAKKFLNKKSKSTSGSNFIINHFWLFGIYSNKKIKNYLE